MFARTMMASAFALLALSVWSGDAVDAPIPSKAWAEKYSNALTIRYVPDKAHVKQFRLYMDGKDSPYVKYLDEMSYYGFNGIRIVMPYADSPESGVYFDKATGKYAVSETTLKHVRAMVDAAIERGFFVSLSPSQPPYAQLARRKKPEERFTDNHLKRHYDVFKAYAEYFKGYSRGLSFASSREVHMWQYEINLPENDPRHMDWDGFHEKFAAFSRRAAEIVRSTDPERTLFFNAKGARLAMKLPFPLAKGDVPPGDPGVLYGIIENNYGPNAKSWEWYEVPNPPKHCDMKSLLNGFGKRLVEVFEFTRRTNVGLIVKNWGSAYNDSPKPGMPKAAAGFRQITDYQCRELSKHILDFFEKNDVCYEYADLRAEWLFWNPAVDGLYTRRAPVDRLLRQIFSFQRVKRLTVTSSAGGGVSLKSDGARKTIRNAYLIAPGSKVSLEAIPAEGYKFAGWFGNISGTMSSATFAMPGENGVVYAKFVPSGASKTASLSPEEKKHATLFERSWIVNPIVDYAMVDTNAPAKAIPAPVNMLVEHVYDKETKRGGDLVALMKFRIGGVPGDGSRLAYVDLKFLVHSYETRCGSLVAALYSVPNDWNRTKISGPVIPDGEPLGMFFLTARSTANVHFDITDLVRKHGDGTYSFAIKIWKAAYNKNSYDPKTSDLGVKSDSPTGKLMVIASRSDDYKHVNMPLVYVAVDKPAPARRWNGSGRGASR